MNRTAKQLFLEALKATNPSRLIEDSVSVQDKKIIVGEKNITFSSNQPAFCFAAGKASLPMIRTLKEKLNLPSSNLLCITPDKPEPESWCVSSSHPLPDQKSKNAADKLIQFIEGIPAGSVIFFLLSGGTSSLACKPADDINLKEIAEVNTLLLNSGTAIDEINGVRKHLSSIKGGQLLSCFPAQSTLIDLIISDVPSNNPENIGSGLTIPDSSTFQDAYDTLLRYELWNKTPKTARNHIEKGLVGEVPETIKPGEDPVENHHSWIIGSAEIFAEKLAGLARKKGDDVWIADEAFSDDVGKVAKLISGKIKQSNNKADGNVALIFYGESTVKVTGNGKGGRNQELALRGALEIDGMKNVAWLSAGTDGIDGPTDAAGAIVDGSTIKKARKKELNAEEFIAENDSYHFHEQMETLLKTGPTGNNVMDIVVILIDK